MTKKDSQHDKLECTTTCETNLVKPNTPFEWIIHIKNTSSSTLHISKEIYSYNVISKEVLEVSTEMPQIAKGVNLTFLKTPETIPVDANQTIDQKFQITLPLRIGKFTGVPPRIEMEEWIPQDEFELRIKLAHGEQPFYPPPDVEQLNEEIRKWTNVTIISPIKLNFKEE